MSALRCTLCSINYPRIAQFKTCPIHGESTTLHTEIEPDPDWQARLAKLQRQADEASRPFPIAHDVETHEDAGQLFISQEALYRAGVRLSSARPNFYLVELDDGWIYETQGWDDARRRWWVERVITVDPEIDVFVELEADVSSSV